MPLLILIAIVILFSVYHYRDEIKKNRQYYLRILYGLVIGAILLRYGQAVFAVIAVVLPFLLRNLGSLSYLAKIFHLHAKSKQTTVDKSSKMTKKEAADILGVDVNASKVEINQKYKKLMKAVHPDMDGSKYISSLINNAKDTLLK